MKLPTKLQSLTSSQIRKDFLNLIVFYSAYLWFRSISNAVLTPHFYQQGLSFTTIIFGIFFYFLGAIIFQLLFKTYSAKKHWLLSIITFYLSIILIIHITHPLQFYLSSTLGGFSLIGFFLLYNIAHFERTPKNHTGFSSALMFSIGPLINLVTPIIAGSLAEINYFYIWLISGISALFAVFFSTKQIDFTINYSLKDSINYIKSTRVFILIQGIWEALVIAIIPVYTLFFIKSPLKYGLFLAYLSFMSIIANLILGRFTDKIKKRSVFLYPLTINLALITLLFPLTTKTIFFWLIITGAIKFILPLFYNISTSLVIDAHQNVRQAIPGREFILSIGRGIGLIATLISFYLEPTPKIIFFFLGAIMIVYPAVLYYRTKISKRYNYL